MKIFAILTAIGFAGIVSADSTAIAVPTGCDPAVMGKAYWKIWNPEAVSRLNDGIEKYRKADGVFAVDAKPGTEVKVEQVAHSFRFGAHTFDIGRQPTEEINRRYEENFAKLFNQATIAFYWRGFETAPGDCHFHTRPGDLESAFTSGALDKMDPHSRYLASPSSSTDQFLEFAKNRGMFVHGHPLFWGSEEWMMPFWIYDQFCPEEEKAFLRLPRKDPREITRLFGEREWIDAYRARIRELFARYSEEEIAARCPVYLENLRKLTEKRIVEILKYCGDRVDSWDVVNESSLDWARACGGSCSNDKPMVKSCYGVLPKNYALEIFRVAAAHASPRAKLSINDWNMQGSEYRDQIADMLAHGARIDMVGAQFHIFSNEGFLKLVDGASHDGVSEPDTVEALFARLGAFGKPVNLSEITIPSPGNTPKAKQQQAIVAANLYRAWFAQPSCCGITWWHTLDGANKAGGLENGYAGVMDAEGNPKPVYNALYELIHRQWKTKLTVKAEKGDRDGNAVVKFRGFRGRYRLTWKNAEGESVSEDVFLK